MDVYVSYHLHAYQSDNIIIHYWLWYSNRLWLQNILHFSGEHLHQILQMQIISTGLVCLSAWGIE